MGRRAVLCLCRTMGVCVLSDPLGTACGQQVVAATRFLDMVSVLRGALHSCTILVGGQDVPAI